MRTKLTSLADNYYSHTKKALQSYLDKVSGVSITTDAVTLSTHESYITVTAHFITDKWKLESVVLGLTFAPSSHTGTHVADLIEAQLTECSPYFCLGSLHSALNVDASPSSNGAISSGLMVVTA